MPASSPPRSHWIWRAFVCSALGFAAAWAVGWACAALRPTDGGSNVLRQTVLDWETYFLAPQYRCRTPRGDVFVDHTGGALITTVAISRTWCFPPGHTDGYLASYPYPAEVPAEWMAVLPSARFTLPAWAPDAAASPAECVSETSAWGWPFRCIRGSKHTTITFAADGTFTSHRYRFEDFWIRSGSPMARIRMLPLRPVWPGLIANAVLYGLTFAGILAAGRAIRRVLRRRRGMCASCGYDLAHAPADLPCPECGSPALRHV